MESNRAGVCHVRADAIHNQQLAVSDPENTYFNKINRTIRLLLNSVEDELEQHLIGKNISRDHFP